MPTAGGLADFVVLPWAESLRKTPMWLGLVTANPFLVTDPLVIEVAGTSAYRRPQASWSRSGRVLTSTTPATWNGIPPLTTVLGIAGFSAPFNGELMAYMKLPDPGQDFPTGGSFTMPAGELWVGVGA